MENGTDLQMLLPQDAADRSGVHLRTIFRWAEHGYLTLVDGKISLGEIQQIQNDFARSVPNISFRRDFGVCLATLRDWKARGAVETVNVLGTERILRTSYDRVTETKIGRRQLFHPDYVPVNDLLRVTGLECKVLNAFIANGVVRSAVIAERTMIPRDVYDHYKALMESTMRPADVEKLLKEKKWTIHAWRKSGRLQDVEVLGRIRISKESVELELKRAEADQKRRWAEEVRLKKLEDEQKRIYEDELRRAKLERKRKKARTTAGSPVVVSSLGSLKVYSIEQVCTRLSFSKASVEELFRKGTLRGRTDDDKIYIIASSLEAYERRNS